MSMELAREMVARAWCQPKTEKKLMDPDLAEEFARKHIRNVKKAVLNSFKTNKRERPKVAKVHNAGRRVLTKGAL